MKLSLTPRSLLLAAGAFSAVMLFGALIAQYGFGLFPCHLCLLQRYPYLAVIGLALLAYGIFPPRFLPYAALFCGGLFLLDAGIAFYHTGVELQWFPGPSGCASPTTGGETLEDMRRALMEAPLVSCSQAMAHILGLSLAAWNALFASAAAIAMFIGFRRVKS